VVCAFADPVEAAPNISRSDMAAAVTVVFFIVSSPPRLLPGGSVYQARVTLSCVRRDVYQWKRYTEAYNRGSY
jgi:hypothetical protein